MQEQNPGGLRSTLANAALGLARRLNPTLKSQAQPLPGTLTNSAQQSAHAQQQVLKSQQSNQGRRGGFPNTNNMGAQGLASADPIQDEMVKNQAPQATDVPMFAPGSPLAPAPGLVPADGPREREYQVGYNIGSLPRNTELTSFSQLRNLALLFDAVQLCESVYFDVIARLQLKITFEPDVIPDGESEQDEKWRAIAQPPEEWLQRPDGVTDYHNWMIASVRDVLELGQSPIYLARDRMGEVLRMDLVDGATMKPLLDERGRTPQPPFPAYQQFLYGIPAGRYTTDNLFMMRETSRSDSIYPFSRVERIILRINQALRKQNLDLARYTDGAIPEGLIFPPGDAETTWTPEQLQEYEQAFNGLLAGNDRYKVRMKFGPPGGTFVDTRSGEDTEKLMAFDTFLLNITVAVFGLTMDEISFTQDSNRSVGQSQQNVVYRRVIEPLANRYAHFFTRMVKEKFDRRLRVMWTGMEEREDQLTKVQTLQIGVQSGALSVSRMAREMGWPVDVEVPPFIVAKGDPVFLEDAMMLREQQVAAKQAGLELAMSAPALAAAPGQPGQPGQPNSGPGQKPGDEEEEDDQQPQKGPPGNTLKGPPGKVPPKNQPPGKPGTPPPAQKPSQRVQDEAEAMLSVVDPSEDYRRWKTVAEKAIKAGRRVPRFVSDLIPREDWLLLSRDLENSQTLDEVRAAFQRAKVRQQTRGLTPVRKLTSIEEGLQTLPPGTQSARNGLSRETLAIFEEAVRRGHGQLT